MRLLGAPPLLYGGPARGPGRSARFGELAKPVELLLIPQGDEGVVEHGSRLHKRWADARALQPGSEE